MVPLQCSLKIGLANIDGGEIVIAQCCDENDQADHRRADNGREHAFKINAGLLGVAVGDEARLELVNRAILLAFDCKHEVAVHDVGALRQGREQHHLPSV